MGGGPVNVRNQAWTSIREIFVRKLGELSGVVVYEAGKSYDDWSHSRLVEAGVLSRVPIPYLFIDCISCI